jgi:hypothetical protein
MDQPGTTSHIIKYGEENQQKVDSRQSNKGIELRITCHPHKQTFTWQWMI